MGKYESSDSECLIFNQNNTSEYNTVSCELILLRFGDTDFENDLKSAQKVDIDIRNDTNTTKYHLISGQIDDKECWNKLNLIKHTMLIHTINARYTQSMLDTHNQC